MAPPRKHRTDDILDAARDIVLADGPRAASVAVISRASGAPVGTLYHRFGSRDGLVAAAWLRALERFQAEVLAADAAHRDHPVAAGAAMAGAMVAFAGRHPGDARLLLAVRRGDLLDAAPEGFRERLDAINAPLETAVARVARALHGRAGARAVESVTRAVVDLPGAALRRHLVADGRSLPPWLAGDVIAAAKLLLGAASSAR
ncbi:TetR/AcrR family transcriptional regulator [Baekduia soli]|uniref:TetR/AcrR family transcriptional regulator n=1 Tax=Baekduia soli TaxID=496014 RepID=A0A5B8U8U5_9ACTN|nr:TetR/AcrR family transcriptional regulator [Baekduia soli]QEC49415.1 TetR/AcrR family transcriptional regulator [Baekduia soli]